MQENKKKLSAKETILYIFESLIMFFDAIMALSMFMSRIAFAGIMFLLTAFVISPFCEKLLQKVPIVSVQNYRIKRVEVQIICSAVLFIIAVSFGALQTPTNTSKNGTPVIETVTQTATEKPTTETTEETELTTTTFIEAEIETTTTPTTTSAETEIETTTITTKNQTETSVKISTQDNLSSFLLALAPEITRDEVKKLAQSYNLFMDYKNTGTGIYKYRFANSEKVAKNINPEKGSVITASFNALQDNILEEITYFDEEKMVGGFWKLGDGYSMIDYNNPQIIADSSTSQIAINSFDEVVSYQPEISNKDNLLEELFMSVSESTTKNDIINYAKEHNLVYTFRGRGNENLIAYSNDVIEKFGNDGSYISFDYDSNEIITHLAYFEYPYQYKTGYSANYYSESYSYSELTGYYLYAYEKEPVQYVDARTLIDKINKSR